MWLYNASTISVYLKLRLPHDYQEKNNASLLDSSCFACVITGKYLPAPFTGLHDQDQKSIMCSRPRQKLIAGWPAWGPMEVWLRLGWHVGSLASSYFQSPQSCGTADGRALCRASQNWYEFLLEPQLCFLIHFPSHKGSYLNLTSDKISILNSSLFTISGGLK